MSPLSLSVSFSIARLSFPHLVPAFSHFLWLVPPSHSFLLTCHSGIWAITTVPHWPAARKKTTCSLFLSRWVQQSQPWPSHIAVFWVNRRGWRRWCGGVGVSLISRASGFYSLRQSWLPLFGCQYESRGSGAIVSSRERTEQIWCSEEREGSEAAALLPSR